MESSRKTVGRKKEKEGRPMQIDDDKDNWLWELLKKLLGIDESFSKT